MKEYFPDRWVILKINTATEIFYKVFASWHGGFTQGESWKFSSKIEEVEDRGTHFYVKMNSGSAYSLFAGEAAYSTSGFTEGVLQHTLEKYPQASVLSFEQALEVLRS